MTKKFEMIVQEGLSDSSLQNRLNTLAADPTKQSLEVINTGIAMAAGASATWALVSWYEAY